MKKILIIKPDQPSITAKRDELVRQFKPEAVKYGDDFVEILQDKEVITRFDLRKFDVTNPAVLFAGFGYDEIVATELINSLKILLTQLEENCKPASTDADNKQLLDNESLETEMGQVADVPEAPAKDPVKEETEEKTEKSTGTPDDVPLGKVDNSNDKPSG